jgi:hypothetical protein
MKILIIVGVVLALFGAGVGLILAAPEPSHVSPNAIEGPGIRAELSSKVLNGPYACCYPPTPGPEGPDCR